MTTGSTEEAEMRAAIGKVIKWASILVALAALTFFAGRVYVVQRGPPLARRHTFVPHELRAKELDALDWSRYLAEEADYRGRSGRGDAKARSGRPASR